MKAHPVTGYHSIGRNATAACITNTSLGDESYPTPNLSLHKTYSDMNHVKPNAMTSIKPAE